MGGTKLLPICNNGLRETKRERAAMKQAWLRFDVVFFCLIGIGSYWAWSGALLITASLWPSADVSYLHATWLVNVAAHCVCLLAFGLLSKRLAPYSQRRILVVAAPLFIIVGTGALTAGYAFSAFGITLAGSTVSGVGTALILLMWGEACTRLQEGDVQRLVLSGSVVAGLMVILLIVCLPPFMALLACFALPVVMVTCITHANELLTCEPAAPYPSPTADPAQEPDSSTVLDIAFEPASDDHAKRTFTRLLLCCFVLALPAGLYQNSYAGTSQGDVVGSWGMVFSCVCVFIMLAILFDLLFMKRGSTNLFSRLTVPLMAGGLLILSVFATGLESWAGVFMQTGYHLFLIYIYTEFSVFASETGTAPSRIFAYGTSAIDVGLLAGFGLLSAMTPLSAGWSIGAILAVVYLLILVGILVFPKVLEDIENKGRDKKALELLRSREQVQSMPERDRIDGIDDSLDRRRDAFCARYGLSPREREIVDYLLRGRSLRSIATETFLSYNTVKTHVSHIYRKANVHTRDELIDAFDTMGDKHG